jgi:hypothetical protein
MSNTIQTLSAQEIDTVSGAGFLTAYAEFCASLFASSSLDVTHTNPDGSSTSLSFDNVIDLAAHGSAWASLGR